MGVVLGGMGVIFFVFLIIVFLMVVSSVKIIKQ